MSGILVGVLFAKKRWNQGAKLSNLNCNSVLCLTFSFYRSILNLALYKNLIYPTTFVYV